jgi:hypothetical protein
MVTGGFGQAAETVERLPLLLDEPGACGAAQRGSKFVRRIGKPVHAAKRFAPVQKPLDFSSPVGRFPGQLQRRSERIQGSLVVVQVQSVGDPDVPPGADLAVAVLLAGKERLCLTVPLQRLDRIPGRLSAP